jgi:Protein of unknown function DUF47/Phosphate transporter family
MPKEERFFDLFDRHAVTIVAGAHALRSLLDGGEKVPEHCKETKRYENDADVITRDVLLAVRRTFITPFDRGDIRDLITVMDDTIDQMHQTAKATLRHPFRRLADRPHHGLQNYQTDPDAGLLRWNGGRDHAFSRDRLRHPVSTTHTITGAIVGVGAARRVSAVRWNIAKNIVVAWVITMPMAGIIAAIFYALARLAGWNSEGQGKDDTRRWTS